MVSSIFTAGMTGCMTKISRGMGFRERVREGEQNSSQGSISTLFVDNLPYEIPKIWVHNLFSKFGKIRESFFPLKRSKISGNKFGFVRFKEDATHAIAQINGTWRWGYKLAVKFARFQKKLAADYKNQSLATDFRFRSSHTPHATRDANKTQFKHANIGITCLHIYNYIG